MKNLLSLTENLLTWAQLQNKGIKIDPQNICLEEMIKSVFRSQHLIAKNKEVLLEVDCAAEIEVYADANMLETILRNLVANSLKFTKLGGLISVRGLEKDDRVLIQIEDTELE